MAIEDAVERAISEHIAAHHTGIDLLAHETRHHSSGGLQLETSSVYAAEREIRMHLDGNYHLTPEEVGFVFYKELQRLSPEQLMQMARLKVEQEAEEAGDARQRVRRRKRGR